MRKKPQSAENAFKTLPHLGLLIQARKLLSRGFFYLENKGKVFTYSRELEKDFRATVLQIAYTEMPRTFCEIRL